MESIVFFGKGGIGKSTIASNVSVVMAREGKKVLHIGCDPKMDSSLGLTKRAVAAYSVVPGSEGESRLREYIHRSSVEGVDCIEAGGPQPGIGCAGVGIGAMLEAIKGSGVLEEDGYTAMVFDVLGDVVCGGFAAPLRRGFAQKVVIVVSEEMLSLYSANRLITMVSNYERNGVWLAGLVINAKDARGVRVAADFAKAVKARVLGIIPRDAAVYRAEKARVPAVVLEPGSGFSLAIERLSENIRKAVRPLAVPKALSGSGFTAFMSGEKAEEAEEEALAEGEERKLNKLKPAERMRAAGFSFAGVEGGQLVCMWRMSCKNLLRTASS